MSEVVLSPAFFSSLVLNSSDLISIINDQGIYSYVGQSAFSILGYYPEELIGTSALDYIHPDDLPIAGSALATIATQKSVNVPSFRFRAKNGQWRWVDCVITNMLNDPNIKGVVSNARDVTAKVEAEHRLEESEASYRSLFFNHPDAVFALTTNGAFEKINQSIEQVLGYEMQEIIGKNFRELLHPDYYETAGIAFTKALNGEANKTEIKAIKKNGEVVFLNITVVPILLRGKVTGIHGIGKDITKIKKANDIIRAQAEQLSSVFESITEALFVVNKHWQFIYVNSVFAAQFKLNKEDYIGRNIWELFPEFKQTQFYKACLQAAETQQAIHFDEYFPVKDITLSFAIYPFAQGVSVYYADITSRKKIADEWQQLSIVASKINSGVVIMNAKGAIEWVNDGFCRLTGYSREEVKGQIPSNLLQGNETDPATSARIRQKYASLLPFTEEVLNYRKSGERLWFAIDVTPTFDEAGNLTNYIAIETDITEVKKKEEELKSLAENLLKQNQDLQQFTYIVSHNLRAPVANLVGLSRLLKNLDKTSGKFETALANLATSALHLDMVIKDLNKILSSRSNLQTETSNPVELREIIELVLDGLKEKTESCQAQILNLIGTNCFMNGNKAYLYSIFNNLLSNALKYRSPERPLVVTIAEERLGEDLLIRISDNGLGFDKEKAGDQVFKLYRRFHNHTEGRGMGLYLVKTQVEAMGGSISVESSLGQGTTFTISLKQNSHG